MTLLALLAVLLLAVCVQVFPSALGTLGGTSVEQGILLSALFLLYPPSAAYAGLAADRVGKGTVIAVSCLLLAASFAAAALLPDIRLRSAAVLFFGLANGALESQASALLADLHPGRERAMLNVSQLFYCVGAVGGPALVALVFSRAPDAGVEPVLWAAAGLGLALGLGFALRGVAAGKRRDPALEAVAVAAAGADPEAGRRTGVRIFLHDRRWVLLCAALFLYVAAEMGTAGWLAKDAEDRLGLSRALAPMALVVFWSGVGISRSLVGFLPIRLRDRTILTGACAIMLVGQILSFTISRPVPALICLGMTGFGMGSVWPTIVSVAGARYRGSSGAAVGFLVAGGAVAVPAASILVGFLSRPDAIGLQGTLLGLSAFTLANLFLVRAATRPPSELQGQRELEGRPCPPAC